MREGFRKDMCAMLDEVKRTSGISEYVIQCDTTNNTTETIDRHELWCKIGIKPISAIEFIFIDLDVQNGNVGMSETSNMVVKQS